MERKLTSMVFKVDGMSCPSCEMKIENVLRKIEGVVKVKASLAKSQVMVEYDPAVVETSPSMIKERIEAAITKLGYEVGASDSNKNVKKKSINQLLGVGIIVFALYFIIKSTIGFNFIPQVDKSVGYGMLFVIGLFTSLHCIAMCGGINLSQCIKVPPSGINLSQSISRQQSENVHAGPKWSQLKPSLLYNTGRVISYTIIGGIVGALGSVIGFSGSAKGIVAIAGGIFMVIIGINMLDIFPWLRRIKISTPKFLGNKIYNSTSHRGPFFVGLLNGLMPCGPLQTMQFYALGTGSFLTGATSMFLFSLGTVPLMFGFGAVSSFLSNKFTHRMLKVSAVLVIVLGLTMVGRGLSLSGVSIAAANPLSGSKAGNVAKIVGGVQEVTTTMESGRYQPFVVQKGIPVRWTIKARAEDLNGCNNPVTIPKYNIQKKLVPGDNVIEFTPSEEGNITYTCWMGMISSNIKVVSNLSKISEQDLQQADSSGNSSPLSSGGSCCSASANATRFYGGRVPTDDIQVAKVVNGVQEVTIKVNDQGYSPAAVILQRGLKTKIKFNPEKINSCNYVVTFPEYNGQLDLSKGQTETPEMKVTQDFTFQCWMGMLHGYVKVVDDIQHIDIKAIKKEIENYKPAGGGGCCGG
jgi:sulfite exporter TauE/SafE/copper chaperone CopZ